MYIKCTNEHTKNKVLIIPGRSPLAFLTFGSRDVSFYLCRLLVSQEKKILKKTFQKKNFRAIFKNILDPFSSKTPVCECQEYVSEQNPERIFSYL